MRWCSKNPAFTSVTPFGVTTQSRSLKPATRFATMPGVLARRGPTVYDQPAYEIRTAEAGGYEVRRQAVS